jgi:hypothetical protein
MAARGRAFMELLAPIWSAPARRRAVRGTGGMGLGRLALSALFLALALTWVMWVDLRHMLAEAPGIVAQLPELSIKGGELVATPPMVAPLILSDSQGKEVAILDLEGRTRLESRDALVMFTRSRVLVKGGDGGVQAFPLGGLGQQDQQLKKADLLKGVATTRWLALAIFLPVFYVFALFMLAVEFVLLGVMAHVPNLIYRLTLDGAGRLRLASLGLPPSTALVAVALVLGLPSSLPMVALVLGLVWVLLGAMALDAHHDPEPPSNQEGTGDRHEEDPGS